jgi:putative permease
MTVAKKQKFALLEMFLNWTHKYFSDPEAVLLLILVIGGLATVVTLGGILAPILASVVIAYLLYGIVNFFTSKGLGKLTGVFSTYILFLAIYIAIFLLIFPLVWKQMASLFTDLPVLINKAKLLLDGLTEEHPMLLAFGQGQGLAPSMLQELQQWGKTIFSASLSSIPGVISWIIYLILVPLLVFFFMKDSDTIISWCIRFLPDKRPLLTKVWGEVDEQMGNYVRGKAIEIAVVGISTYVVFLYFGLNYSALLAMLVGFSVVIPYVGAAVITIPVILVAYLQWGWNDGFLYLIVSYLVVQVLDGNLLVPVLFSEALNLHPVAIMIAIIVFGAFWGFWGVFFAIPLATVLKSVLNAWPKKESMS